MRPLPGLIACATLAACDGVAWNTTVADNMAVRGQMAASVLPGRTTETAFITRWGRPVQKVRTGGQVEYIYRNMRIPEDEIPLVVGDSTRYVIVTFQYGIATAVRTSETEICRATFAPRPPGHAYATPMTVRPVETCPGLYRPPVGQPVLPPGATDAGGTQVADGSGTVAGAGNGESGTAGGGSGGSGTGGSGTGGSGTGGSGTGGGGSGGGGSGGGGDWPAAEPIYDDIYVPGGKAGK